MREFPIAHILVQNPTVVTHPRHRWRLYENNSRALFHRKGPRVCQQTATTSGVDPSFAQSMVLSEATG